MENLPKFVGSKIKQLRNQKNWTQEELAQKIKVVKTAIGNYERGERAPGQDALFELAEVFEVSIDFFFPLTKKNPEIFDIYPRLVKERQEDLDAQAKNHYLEQESGWIYKSEKSNPTETIEVSGATAAGDPIDNALTEEREVSSVPKNAEVALIVKGDSMEPLFPDGSIVFYKKQPTLENGEIGVFAVDGGVTLKKYKIDYDKKEVRLMSLNKKYDDIVLKEVTILGKVVNDDVIPKT